MRALLVRSAAAAVFTLGACADNTTDPVVDEGDPSDPVEETDEEDPPTVEEASRDYDELAPIIAAHVRGEFALQLAAAAISETQFPEGFYPTGDGAGAGAVGSMSYNFTYHCNDGTVAHTVVPCDGTAHHSHIKIEIAGSQSVGSMAMDGISRTVDWEIRDLTLDKARFRGPDDAALQTSITANGEVTTYSVRFGALYEQVRYLPAQSVPTFGTIDFNLNVERTRGADRRVFNTTAQLVYGAAGAPSTVTFDGTFVYSIDLSTGATAKL